MHVKFWAGIAIGALMLAGCGDDTASRPVEEAPGVPLVNSNGQIIGEVRAGDSDDSAVLMVSARGLPPGEHGVHIHDIGICEPPGFQSAGPHWNPTAASHGFQNPEGPHGGDLRNVTVGEDGRLRVEIAVPRAYLRTAGLNVEQGARQILDASGAALVVHAQADDYQTDPSGASGDRIACAELGEPAPGAVITPETAVGNASGNTTTNAAGSEASAG